MTSNDQRPFSRRAWLIAVIAGLLCGLLSLSQPIDLMLKFVQFKVHSRPVSGEIVVVGVDDKALDAQTDGGWDRSDAAATINAIREAGAERLFIDYVYDQSAEPEDTARLEQALAGWRGDVFMAVRSEPRNWQGIRENKASILTGIEAAQQGSIRASTNIWAIWNLPYAITMEGKVLPSFSAQMANLSVTDTGEYWLDFSYDYKTVPTYSAKDVIDKRVGREDLSGKTVIFAPTAPSLHDIHYMPGKGGKVPGAYFHIIGAATLVDGLPWNLGWFAIWACVVFYTALMRLSSTAVSGISSALIYHVPVSLCAAAILIPTTAVVIWIGPAFVTSAVLAASAARRRRQRHAQRQHHESGLPNFEALRNSELKPGVIIVAAKLVNFESLSVYLPQDGAKALEREVVRRLGIATAGQTLYHDENGFFAWVMDADHAQDIEEQLAGLTALFIAPVRIEDERIDAQLAFGIDESSAGTTGQKLAAAMVAASHSQRERKSWSAYRPPQDEEARWQHSFQSQLNQALLNGEIWVAYQPQLDVASNRIVGAEALARWTHPRLGDVSPEEFIHQAEKHQRIERLTLFVLNDAIGRVAILRQSDPDFSISVNMSALLLHRSDLVGQIRALLTTHGVPARCLTIEITETAEIDDNEAVGETLAALKALGCRLSIDDYGTGQSNLDYLAKFEADEIKIDKRFIADIADSNRNREVVTSTIQMAHRLGAKTVAEGVEGLADLNILSALGCDVIQGYLVGKPMIFDNLRTITETTRSGIRLSGS